MSSPWWAAFGPVETEVSCSSGRHRVLWADGTLHAAEHADAEGELVLAALGGDATPCLDLVRTWERHCDDLVALMLAPRFADDVLTITTAEIDELAARRHPFGSGSRGAGPGGFTLVEEGDPGRHELLRLLALGTPFQLRLSGAVAHAWSAWGPHAARAGRESPALTAALTGRVAPAAARWLDVDLTEVKASIYSRRGWGAIEMDSPSGEVRLKVGLPVSWLAWVWAPGLAVVDGHFVVSVRHAAWPTAQVLAISGPGRAPIELTVRHGSDGWTRAGH